MNLVAAPAVDIGGRDARAGRRGGGERPQHLAGPRIDQPHSIPVAGGSNLEVPRAIDIDQGVLATRGLRNVAFIGFRRKVNPSRTVPERFARCVQQRQLVRQVEQDLRVPTAFEVIDKGLAVGCPGGQVATLEANSLPTVMQPVRPSAVQKQTGYKSTNSSSWPARTLAAASGMPA